MSTGGVCDGGDDAFPMGMSDPALEQALADIATERTRLANRRRLIENARWGGGPLGRLMQRDAGVILDQAHMALIERERNLLCELDRRRGTSDHVESDSRTCMLS